MIPIHFAWGLIATALLACPRIADAAIDECRGVNATESLAVMVNSDSLLGHLKVIQDKALKCGGHRMAGSLGHNQTIDYIQGHLRSLGYYVEVQHFQGLMQVENEVFLKVQNRVIKAEAMGWSPSCNLANRPLVSVNGTGCKSGDYPEEAVGSIVLVGGGDCSLSTKSIAAGKAGANALILYDTTELTPSLGIVDNNHIPSARISERDSQLLRNPKEPKWASSFQITTRYETVSSYNVFAT